MIYNDILSFSQDIGVAHTKINNKKFISRIILKLSQLPNFIFCNPLLRLKNKDLLILNHQRRVNIDNYYSNPSAFSIKKPSITNLDLWFEDFIIDELVIIKEQILNLEDDDLIDFALIDL